jgi:hypothetical protein
MRTRPAGPAGLLAITAAVGCAAGAASAQTIFYNETFNSAVRNQTSGDPRITLACGASPVWSKSAPGWTVNDCGVSTYACRTGLCPPQGFTCATCTNTAGILEFEGWSFVLGSWWITVDAQQRPEFFQGSSFDPIPRASGIVAVADPDEWDDEGDPDTNCGYYNAFMTSPTISLTGADLSTLSLEFGSSWRDECCDDGESQSNNQTASIVAVYTTPGGTIEVPVLLWQSDPNLPNFKDDAPNELVTLSAVTLNAPVGATAVSFRFGLTNAGNDWWWAVDNLYLRANVLGTPTTLWFEDFEGVTLQPPVNEGVSGCAINYCGVGVYTHVGPNGVTVGLDPAAGTGGVPDWRGWSFVDAPFFTCIDPQTVNGIPQGRAQFALSDGVFAVADSDEFDDLPGGRPLITTLSTPAINIAARTTQTLVLSFASSWAHEPGQNASITAVYDVGGSVQLAYWSGNPLDAEFKGTNLSELVVLPLVVPPGATTVSIRFYYEGTNNWWWAIDNIKVFEGEATVSIEEECPVRDRMYVAPLVNYPPCFTPWAPDAPLGWTEEPFTGTGGRPEWQGWSFANWEWWYTNVDNQLRDQFTLADGFIAIADPDEWDDFPTSNSFFNAYMTSPAIPLPGSFTTVELAFDSSWRPECCDDAPGQTNNQTATIEAVYTVGGVDQPPVNVLLWQSNPSLPNFKPDATNERVTVGTAALQIPVGATAVKFRIGLSNARNDWWWAMDDLELSVDGARVFLETFDQPQNLQAPPTEQPPTGLCRYWSRVADQGTGWTADNSGVSGCNFASSEDFYGFAAWLKDAWVLAEGGSRNLFGSPTAYVSDFQARGCDGTALLLSPVFNIGIINENSLQLSFRSGWLAEVGHVSQVQVSYNGGPFTPVLVWNADAAINDPTYKASSPDEIVTLALNNPPGATSVRLRFVDQSSGYWAICDVSLTGTVGQAVQYCDADWDRNGSVEVADIFAFLSGWFSNDPASVSFGGTPGVPAIFAFLSAWFGAGVGPCTP